MPSGSTASGRCGAPAEPAEALHAHLQYGRARAGVGFPPRASLNLPMSVMVSASRTQVWLQGLGDWSWRGQGGAAFEYLPPPWVPAFPPRREAAAGARALPAPAQPGR